MQDCARPTLLLVLGMMLAGVPSVWACDGDPQVMTCCPALGDAAQTCKDSSRVSSPCCDFGVPGDATLSEPGAAPGRALPLPAAGVGRTANGPGRDCHLARELDLTAGPQGVSRLHLLSTLLL